MEKNVRKKIRYNRDGINLVGDINASISTGEPGQSQVTKTSTRSRNRIVQRGGKTWSVSEYDDGSNLKEVKDGHGDS
jgi:hypothetical protein